MESPEILDKNREVLFAKFVKDLDPSVKDSVDLQKLVPYLAKIIEAKQEPEGEGVDLLALDMESELEKDPLDEDLIWDQNKVAEMRKDPDLDDEDTPEVHLDEDDRV